MTCTCLIAHSGAGVGTEALEAAFELPSGTMAATGKRDGSATTVDLTHDAPARAGVHSTV